MTLYLALNTLRPRQDGRRFPDDTFERIFLNENVIILIKISLKFVPYGPINNIPALVQIMAWPRSGDKPLSEPMVGRLPTHICVTRPQWVKEDFYDLCHLSAEMQIYFHVSYYILCFLKYIQHSKGVSEWLSLSRAVDKEVPVIHKLCNHNYTLE